MKSITMKSLAGMVIFLLWISAAGGATSNVAQQNPQTSYEPGLHLLVDPDSIVESNGVTMILNQPAKLPDPIVTSTWKPYRFATAWGNVIREPNGLYRMWYLDMIISPHDHAKRKVWGDESDYGYSPKKPGDFPDVDCQFICYAESWDGIKWVKPALGVVEFEGSTANNIVMNGSRASKQFDGAITNMDGCTVVRDDSDPDPNRRYKMLAYWETVHRYDNKHNGLHRSEADIKRFNNKNTRGHYIACSPDGIHFGDLEPAGLPKVGIDRNLIMRDYKRNQWRVNMRPEIPKNENSSFVRASGILTGTDFKTWSELKAVIVPDEGDQFGGIQDFEAFVPFNYGEEDLGFLNVNNMRGKRFSPYLACMGRDGNWKRVFRDQPVIMCGSPGMFDRTGVSPLQNEPIIVGDEMYIYYSAFSGNLNHPAGFRSIGLATMRRDAFVGAAAGVIAPKSNLDTSGEATFTTWPLKVTGPKLAVNFEKFHLTGKLRLELLDENKQPIAGYTLADCEPVTLDAIRLPIVWKSGKDLTDLMGKEVLIRVSFLHGAVYAFKFCP